VWLERNTTEHPDAMISQDELRRAYNTFCENSGKPGMTPQGFGRALTRARSGIQKAQRTWRGVANTRVYLGIGLLGGPEGTPDDDTSSYKPSRDQRDQRIETNRIEETLANVQIDRDKRVDRVADNDMPAEAHPAAERPAKEEGSSNTSGNHPSLAAGFSASGKAEPRHVVVAEGERQPRWRGLTAEQVAEYKRLTREGMSPEQAAAAVRGEADL
jgi:hypothetical protein